MDVYQCIGKDNARVTIGHYADRRVAIYDHEPYGLGKGPDAVALEQTAALEGRMVHGVYTFSFYGGAAWTAPFFPVKPQLDGAALFSHTRFHFFLTSEDCRRSSTPGALTVTRSGGPVVTFLVRRMMRVSGHYFKRLYSLQGIDPEMVRFARKHERHLLKEWEAAAKRACAH